jgi:hypothetical protein
MLSFRRDLHGNYEYVRSPFLSTFVHDALACLDPTSSGWLDDGLDLLPEGSRGSAARAVAQWRQRIRSFLIWQQEPAGYWRVFGRGSGIDPDVNTTVCASLALLDGHGLRTLHRWERQQALIDAFRSESGLYFTFLKPGRGGYGWLSDDGLPVVGFDRVVNSEVLRHLCRVDRGTTPEAGLLADRLLEQMRTVDPDDSSPLYPNPISFGFVLGRALSEHDVPRRAELHDSLLTLVLRQQRSDGGFGGPLSTAMGATTLLALGHHGEELRAARLAVLRARGSGDAWPYEDFVVHGFGAQAWTTALSTVFLVRHYCATGEAPA